MRLDTIDIKKLEEIEVFLLIKEIGRLLTDYGKCTDETIRERIHQDILLLSSVINVNCEQHN
ncbi:hypothetical protein [Domibacillus epiphyticus]|uniref:Uncharacterized protein n=1 Tax=Domibacillus epiphyticus TaxID=1714355 RepID=A0A1V2A409_9BACI|nr:hypothetical protein [Domibacillus epiphyticus]OMP65739.1 hypothetical protein BTO28_15855 [Domibacillus epiphyticus]